MMFACAALLLHPQRAPLNIPDIGRVLCEPIGFATEEDFIRKLGTPKRSIGGHSNSRCTWLDATNGVEISLDGFDRARNGMLVDEISISKVPDAIVRPHMNSGRKPTNYRLCNGAFQFGMSRSASIQVVRAKKWQYVAESDTIRLQAPGNVDFRGVCSNIYHVAYNWTTVLSFKQDKLCSIAVSVDYKSSPE